MTYPVDGEARLVGAKQGELLGGPIDGDGISDVAVACGTAAAAFASYRAQGLEERAAFLDQIAAEILSIGDDLIEVAMRETGLPRTRLEGERDRTVTQLEMFAKVVRAGLWLGLRVDPVLAERKPLPRPDLRMRKVPLGPVAVFGASNFPLAFSTAGGDTASALAAGCPVIVKGHPAHPETGAMVADAILRAAEQCGMPEGTFSHLVGPGNRLGAALVEDPRIAAVAFTGSRSGGLSLLRLAQARPVPVPVFAEMSSINPVILLPGALMRQGASLGAAFVASLTMGAGQFCTNPGLLLAIDSDGLEKFIESARGELERVVGATMLSSGIHSAYEESVEALARHEMVELIGRGQAGTGDRCGRAALFATTADAFLADHRLRDEVFGASSLLLRCRTEYDLVRILEGLEGQLTASMHLVDSDAEMAARLMPLLEMTAGRILANGWPTGVEVTHAMVHGGPYPASSDPRTTSVGSLAIDRFLRPVAYQNMPAALLPPELRDEGRASFPTLVDGQLV